MSTQKTLSCGQTQERSKNKLKRIFAGGDAGDFHFYFGLKLANDILIPKMSVPGNRAWVVGAGVGLWF